MAPTGYHTTQLISEGAATMASDLENRISEDGITAQATRRDAPPSYIDPADLDASTTWWDVTLHYDGRVMRVTFGTAHTQPPTAADVINVLASDSAGYDNTDGLEDWANDYGYKAEADLQEATRKAQRAYEVVGRQRDKFAAFLGDKYDAYLYETERL